MQQRAETPGIYLRHTQQQIDYIRQYAGKHYDSEIAENTGLTKDQVIYYRSQVLKIRNPAGRPVFESVPLQSIQSELTALLQFYATYNGCMMDTLERRIKLLQSKI